MKYKISVKDEAELDLLEAFDWYETEKPGLGNEFLNELDKCIVHLENNPLQYQIIYKNVRRILLQRFPFGVFYLVETNIVHII